MMPEAVAWSSAASMLRASCTSAGFRSTHPGPRGDSGAIPWPEAECTASTTHLSVPAAAGSSPVA
jgi:hypothetical protein